MCRSQHGHGRIAERESVWIYPAPQPQHGSELSRHDMPVARVGGNRVHVGLDELLLRDGWHGRQGMNGIIFHTSHFEGG